MRGLGQRRRQNHVADKRRLHDQNFFCH
jgi:hypothetical protein